MRLAVEELTFHKSSYSDRSNCVEVARFRKSSYSGSGDNCVEVADLPTGAAVLDTQNRSLGALAFPSSEWAALVKIAQGGR
ncbi:DUF397 domain-containing protein [Nocardiopsis valliformis]|uniref:DUF397 domain-containing protein n=1 Tax=Nocardiopsis valliformis TaxID=239974 RepID=UPI00034A2FC1|nr:DUF397 domain-containing protein [Nocardiopsis valliformis]